MPEQVCYLREGFNMYETDPETSEYLFTAYPDLKTDVNETAMLISKGAGAWDLFLTSRGLFYIPRISVLVWRLEI